MGSWTEQSQVVVETVTKTSTTQQFSAPPPRQSDASKVISKGAGLKTAMVNKETTFTVDATQAGEWTNGFLTVCRKLRTAHSSAFRPLTNVEWRSTALQCK